MATTRLAIYNGALTHCGERTIANLTVNEEGRRLLDNVWNDGGVQWCLEQGQWRFAMRTFHATPETAVTPQFGLKNAFAKPSDWMDTAAVCQDEYFKVPLLNYADEAGYWFADLDDIYVKIVSNSASYGMNLAGWPASFTEFVKAYFAWKIAPKLTGGDKIAERLWNPENPKRGVVAIAMLVAKNRDAQSGPTTFPAVGGWIRSRWGRTGNGGWRDGGNRSSLYG
ncbi:hypothetical protein UFOVP1670_23 [uncultured Caudovirales phage]|uniref:Uncharacterized protein n=1 Tax=uncultured Caudovirales phage TaxID=2100421 RepID=A0A6J5T6J2_9CAUD|nr:hypothetical protein UFOVP1670_23 [uncultured Caudovirales phage]